MLVMLCFWGYLYLFVINGGIVCEWNTTASVFSNRSIIRGFCDMSMGVLLWDFSRGGTRWNIKAAPLLEMLFFLGATICALTINNLWIILFAIIISCFFGVLNQKNDCKLYNNRIVELIAPITYFIYLDHALFVDYDLFCFIQNGILRTAVYLVSIVLFSFLCSKIIDIVNAILFALHRGKRYH